MTDFLLPSDLLRRVTPEALERAAGAAGLVRWHESLRFTVSWDMPGGKIDALQTPITAEIDDYLQVVCRAIKDLASITKTHPTNVLRDLIGKPVSIPAQGWRVPRECDYGRKDALERRRIDSPTGRLGEWQDWQPNRTFGLERPVEFERIEIHDITPT